MSTAKVDLLMIHADRLRIAAQDAVAQLGLPDYNLGPGFLRPAPAVEWLLELARQGQQRNPGLLTWLAERMPEPPPEAVQRTATRKKASVAN
jgi:hypothetical protein